MVFFLYKDTFVWYGFYNINPSPWDKKEILYFLTMLKSLCILFRWPPLYLWISFWFYCFSFGCDSTNMFDKWSWSWRRRIVQTLRRQNKRYLKFVHYNFMIQLCFVQNTLSKITQKLKTTFFFGEKKLVNIV